MSDIAEQLEQEVQNPRFLFPAKVMAKFGLTVADMVVLTRSHFPDNAVSPDDLLLALTICSQHDIPWQRRPVEMMSFKTKVGDNWVDKQTLVLGLTWWQTMAQRSGTWAGKKPTEFGPMIEKTYPGGTEYNTNKQKPDVTVRVPEWACVTVLKFVPGTATLGEFSGSKIYWEEFARTTRQGVLLPFHADKPIYALEKTATVNALRGVFGSESDADDVIVNRAAAASVADLQHPAATHPGVVNAAAGAVGYDTGETPVEPEVVPDSPEEVPLPTPTPEEVAAVGAYFQGEMQQAHQQAPAQQPPAPAPQPQAQQPPAPAPQPQAQQPPAPAPHPSVPFQPPLAPASKMAPAVATPTVDPLDSSSEAVPPAVSGATGPIPWAGSS